MKYALASLANLMTLAIGIAIGLILAPHVQTTVQAQAASQQKTEQPQSVSSGPTIKKIMPTMTAPQIGTALLLAHEIQTDRLVVNGYDIMQLHEQELNLMSRLLGMNSFQIQQAIARARASDLYTIQTEPDKATETPKKP